MRTLADFGLLSSQRASEMQAFEEETSPDADFDKDLPTEEEKSKSVTVKKISTPQITDPKQPEGKTLVKIVLLRSLYQDLCHQRPLSRKVEEGGFLIGKVYRDGDGRTIGLSTISSSWFGCYCGINNNKGEGI